MENEYDIEEIRGTLISIEYYLAATPYSKPQRHKVWRLSQILIARLKRLTGSGNYAYGASCIERMRQYWASKGLTGVYDMPIDDLIKLDQNKYK